MQFTIFHNRLNTRQLLRKMKILDSNECFFLQQSIRLDCSCVNRMYRGSPVMEAGRNVATDEFGLQ